MSVYKQKELQLKIQQLQADEKKAQDALDLAVKQNADNEKRVTNREAGFVTFVVSDAGLISRCRIPVSAVAQHGLFRILLGYP